MTDVAQASSSYSAHSESHRQRIDVQLDAYSNFDTGCPDVLQAAIRYILLAPGKRLRPLLTLFAAETCGLDPEAAMPAACAVEMVHAYSLIHDDLPAMDDDDLRRGRPTCHKEFGEASAILAGDALLARAFEVLARDVQPAQVAAHCCQILASAAGASQLVGGQADDLAAEQQDGGGLESLEAIHRRKTGAMLGVALRLGGEIATASDLQLAALTRYGENLGLAFQVVDDLLDHGGNAEQLGKRTQKDANRGKLTYPRLLGVDASRQRAAKLIEDACAALSVFENQASQLTSLARFVLERKR